MTSNYRRAIDEHLEALGSGRFLAQRWGDGGLVHYPRGARLGHRDEVPAWEEVRGGRVVATTTVREHSHPKYQAEAPFTLVLVDLQGGRVMARLDPASATPRIGDTVALRVVAGADGPRVFVS